MATEFEMYHHVKYYECDTSGHPTLAMIVAMLILASEADNKENGVGLKRAGQYGGGWVIINYEGTLAEKQPVKGEEVILGTRVRAYNRFFVIRDFWVKDLAGNYYAKVSGTFVFMNLAKRKIMTIPQEMIDTFQMDETKRLPRLEKPSLPEDQTGWAKRDYRVRYFDIDGNQHVNNAHYFEWMMDVLDGDFLRTHQVVKMQTEFAHEVLYGQTVTSTGSTPVEKEGLMVTHHQITCQGQESARATFYWQPRN